MKQYLADLGLKKLIRLIFTELDKKQDKMDEMTPEEVRAVWNEVRGVAATP